MKRILTCTALLAAFVVLSMFYTTPANAQLILASGTYRVVEIDEGKERIGIAKLDANPNVTQNWVYMRLQTKVTKRFFQDGWQRDEKIEPSEIFSVIEKGDVIKVDGGRDWNGSITAKNILILPDNVDWNQEN
ncbi:hypothetical protein IJT10_07875 [bacterium]|nr:hypothetical protein [bacterium]